ncbi:hypothetical protein PROSTU_00989 [Providencia stuartii ATCC 25827]|uniref:Uncharacterized protein n=1 Tax=Providencia stuartii ATCC 25827 TaxID=471874 RepID=A0AA87CVU5_PROST|nr:hypothetical protein PROSTU_00989 [Providencia stuartii ATCC 25827]
MTKTARRSQPKLIRAMLRHNHPVTLKIPIPLGFFLTFLF